ncbi:MAG: carboxypeptidase-like regulatory domain-containing protein, partial [Bacteroidia bacterium]
MKRNILLLVISLIGFGSYAQITQTVRGKVVDAETRFPLIGATVALMVNGQVEKGTVTDATGNFRIDKVPVGRQNFMVQYVGYKEKILNNIIVTSAKQVILNIELEESAQKLDEVTISVTRNGEVSNEMAIVSAREFSVDETMRYAGSRGDPARTASNFAGVQGADDSRNDIVIRGNSPQSVIWQLEGVIMPNPNHFAIPGTNGGPVSIVNFKTLRNSDFYTGAFPAEFGNSTAGVFDLKLRNGNNQNHEFSGMFGLMGTEAFAEGPLNKEKGSSYLINYRYSTISMFLALGIDVGTNSAPTYQDATFRFTFPQKNGAELA